MKTNDSSPWGPIQTVEAIGLGACSVSTAGHGGVYLPPAMHAMMPRELANLNSYSGRGSPWFEEDVEWALACIVFPQIFTPHYCFYAVKTIQAQAGKEYLGTAAAWLASPSGDLARERAALHREPAPEPLAIIGQTNGGRLIPA